jgi:hypothetical protein
MELPEQVSKLTQAKLISCKITRDDENWFTKIQLTGFYFRYGDCYYLINEELRVTEDDDGLSKTRSYTMYFRYGPLRKFTGNIIPDPLQFRFKQMKGFDIPDRIKKYIERKTSTIDI